jgi:hypothetical protein
MSVTAKQLSKSGARGKDVDSIIREQLQIIDDKLLHADRAWGRNIVAIELPSSFNILGLARQDGQRLVYSTLLRSLLNREFEVRLQMDKARTTLFVAWDADLDQEELDAMNKLIREHRIQAEELAGFRQPPRAGPNPGRAPASFHHAPARKPEEGPGPGPGEGPTAAEKELLATP